MTAEQIVALGGAFAAFAKGFQGCFVRPASFAHFNACCRGLLSDPARKSVEPIAPAAGCAVRTLQEFLRSHVWDHLAMRDRLQRRGAGLPALAQPDDPGTVGLIDETTVVKKGDKTPGVQRMHCGAVGKIENCIMTVHPAVVRGRFKTLVDADLYIPKSRDADRGRRREADIPDGVVHRPKRRMALEPIARARGNGMSFRRFTFDEAYGGVPAFLEELDAIPGAHYVGEVPASFRRFASRPRGNPPNGWAGRRADNPARFSPAFHQQEWRTGILDRRTGEPQAWQVRAARVWPSRRRRPAERAVWLMVARREDGSQTKYFVSDAPADAEVGTLLRVGFTRWNVEHTFRAVKTEIGFSHFEGRSHTALMRQMTMCLPTMTFAAEHTDRLRGEKPGGDLGAGLPRIEPPLPGVAAPAARFIVAGVHG